MNEKRVYLWQLASFLYNYDKKMSGEELADHLNRNGFQTEYNDDYHGGRGVYTLIRNTYNWLHDDLKFPEEAKKIALTFVKRDGTHAWE
jgi:hypothetical protein